MKKIDYNRNPNGSNQHELRSNVELQKIISSNSPSTGFKLLDSTGLLEIIFPELSNLKGVYIKNGNAHKDL